MLLLLICLRATRKSVKRELYEHEISNVYLVEKIVYKRRQKTCTLAAIRRQTRYADTQERLAIIQKRNVVFSSQYSFRHHVNNMGLFTLKDVTSLPMYKLCTVSRTTHEIERM